MADSSSQLAVEFSGVHKAFGENRIYRDLSLGVRDGEILTIIGGSGTGKSVMLKMILGLIDADQGTILVHGEDVCAMDQARLIELRRRVGMVFQGGALFDSMNVLDNVSYALVERGQRDVAAIEARVARVLEMVGLPGVEQLMPAELSGGMKKRIALARAVADVPRLLLYDEPTTGLDPMNVRRISELILQLRGELGVTSVVVTHDLASAFLVSDRLAMLARGRIVEVANLRDFRHSPVPEVQEFLRAMPLADPDVEEVP